MKETMRSRMQSSIATVSKEEWLAEGARLFGPNTDEWRFECPVCGNVAAIKDFRQYKDQGASPNSATCECIGRYTGAKGAFDPDHPKPCDYAGYGLFRISPVIVSNGDIEVHCFAFAVPE